MKNDRVRSSLIELQSFPQSKIDVDPMHSVLMSLPCFVRGSGDVAGVLTLLVGGVAQDFHDDRVVELRVQLGVEEVEGQVQGGTSRSRKRETSQRGCAMMMTMDECEKTQDLEQ